MRKYSEEETQRILDEARHNLERGRWGGRGTTAFADDPPINDDAGKSDTAAFEPPLETRNQRDRRELALQEERFARERRRHQRETDSEIARRLQASADQRVAELESRLAEIVRATTTSLDALEVELSRTTRENSELKTKQAQLETALAELRLTLAERGRVLDLPNPLRAVN